MCALRVHQVNGEYSNKMLKKRNEKKKQNFACFIYVVLNVISAPMFITASLRMGNKIYT